MGLRHFLPVSVTSSSPQEERLCQRKARSKQLLLASVRLSRRPPPASGKPKFISFKNSFFKMFCLRPRRGYLSPALVWLEEEGLPSAEKEAQDKAVEGEMDKEAVMRRAMGKWKRLSMEEKEVWRKRAKECAKTDKK